MTTARGFQRAFLLGKVLALTSTHPVGFHHWNSKHQRSPGCLLQLPGQDYTTSKPAQYRVHWKIHSEYPQNPRVLDYNSGFHSWCICSIISVALRSLFASFHRWSGIEFPASCFFVPFLRHQSLKLWCVLYVLHWCKARDIYCIFWELCDWYECKAIDLEKFADMSESFIPIYILKWIISLPAEDIFFRVSFCCKK